MLLRLRAAATMLGRRCTTSAVLTRNVPAARRVCAAAPRPSLPGSGTAAGRMFTHHRGAATAAAAAGRTAEADTTVADVVEPELTWPSRSDGCGAVAAGDAGRAVTVCGWVDRCRNLGGIIFLDVRDHTGVVQVVVDPQADPALGAKAERLRAEWVVAVTGTLRLRKDPNPKLKTGEVEVAPAEIRVLNAVTRPLPFLVSQAEEGGEPPREELRLRHRVLDLRWVGGRVERVLSIQHRASLWIVPAASAERVCLRRTSGLPRPGHL